MTLTTKMQHTRGPWIICSRRDEPRMIKIGTGEDGWLGVATAFGDTQEEAEANARLIVAAPDLLQACKLLLSRIEDGTLVRDITKDAAPDWAPKMMLFVKDLNTVQAAIIKAEGA